MTEYASFDDLLADGPQEEDVTLQSGAVVRVRGLTRAEHLWIGKGTEDSAEIEARMLSKALLQPAPTLELVKQWQKTGRSRAVSEISDRIRELSGFGEGAQKSDPGTAGDD